jgi:hypothetical protein
MREFSAKAFQAPHCLGRAGRRPHSMFGVPDQVQDSKSGVALHVSTVAPTLSIATSTGSY